MPVPTVGSISLSGLNAEMVRTANTQVSLNLAELREKLSGKSAGQSVSLSELRGSTYGEVTISSNTSNYNVRTFLEGLGWSNTARGYANVTVANGVVVSSANTQTPAMDTGAGYTASSKIVLHVAANGYVVGMGGSGGRGGDGGEGGGDNTPYNPGNPGLHGGLALRLRVSAVLDNLGTVGGGGGGGGGGGSLISGSVQLSGAGGGGGRTGPTQSAKGSGGDGGFGSAGDDGSNGSFSSAGSGGSDEIGGGAGGDWGSDGSYGSTFGFKAAGAGGEGGPAIVRTSAASLTVQATGNVAGSSRSVSPSTFVAITANTRTDGSTIATARPSGLQAGDVLVMAAHCRSAGGTPTLPAGFTVLDTITDVGRVVSGYSGSTGCFVIGWKVANSSEPTTYSAALPGNECAVTAIAFRGATGVGLSTLVNSNRDENTLFSETFMAYQDETHVGLLFAAPGSSPSSIVPSGFDANGTPSVSVSRLGVSYGYVVADSDGELTFGFDTSFDSGFMRRFYLY